MQNSKDNRVFFGTRNTKHRKLYDHYAKVLGQEPIFCMRSKKGAMRDGMNPIVTLVFEPTKDTPFWKLCTIGAVLLLPEIFKSPNIVKCFISKRKYISVFQVMPISREMLNEKLRKGSNGIYWLMERFYMHDDDYNLIASNPLAKI